MIKLIRTSKELKKFIEKNDDTDQIIKVCGRRSTPLINLHGGITDVFSFEHICEIFLDIKYVSLCNNCYFFKDIRPFGESSN